MINIMMNEKRFVRVGEICAIPLCDIWGMELGEFFDEVDGQMFGMVPNFKDDTDLTLVKYLGNGLFLELLSNQIIMCEDFFHLELIDSLDSSSQREVENVKLHWDLIQHPKTMEEYKANYKDVFDNPLCIDNMDCIYYGINEKVAKKLASQSLEKTKLKLISAKLKSQQRLQRQTREYQSDIQNHFKELNQSQMKKSLKNNI